MKEIKEYITESTVDWRNVHDAILTVCRKYIMKPGVSKDVIDYCENIRKALDEIKH